MKIIYYDDKYQMAREWYKPHIENKLSNQVEVHCPYGYHSFFASLLDAQDELVCRICGEVIPPLVLIPHIEQYGKFRESGRWREISQGYN